MLSDRDSFANYYYSQEEDAFKFREFSKLVRTMSCKTSKVSGVRGLDLSGKIVTLFTASTQDIESLQGESPIDTDTGLILIKNAYEKFCPDLW